MSTTKPRTEKNSQPSGIARETAVAKQVWEAARDEANRQDQSHWRGIGRWANDKKWLNVGRSTRKKINFLARAIGAGPEYWAEPRAALEWGPGGGSNVLALMPFCDTIYGIDISQKNLDECARMLDEEGYTTKNDGTGYQPILVGEDPREVWAKVKQPLDVFTSIAVFQHFPSKDYGKQVLLTIREMCGRRAFGVIQIRYDDGKERFRPITNLAEYEAKHITANSYAIPEFYNLCGECGFEVVMITDVIDRSNSATFGLRVK